MFVDASGYLSEEVIEAKLGIRARRFCKKRMCKMDLPVVLVVLVFMLRFLGE